MSAIGKARGMARQTPGRAAGVPAGTGVRINSPRRVKCPKCEAAAGNRCINPRGYRTDVVHAERKEAARAVAHPRIDQPGIWEANRKARQ